MIRPKGTMPVLGSPKSKAEIVYNRARLIALIVVVMLASASGLMMPSVASAQDPSRLAERDSLNARLNRALQLLSPTNPVEYIDVSDMFYLEINGINGCDTVWNHLLSPPTYPTGLRVTRKSNGLIAVEIDNSGGSAMELTYTSHILPCYLNGMMFHNWGKPFVDELGDYVFWDVQNPGMPHPPSTKTPVYTQKYYMGSTAKTPEILASVIPALQDNSYEQAEFEGYTTSFYGNELFRVVRPDMAFIAQYQPAPPGGVDSNIAKPIGWTLEFFNEFNQPTWDPGLDSAISSIRFIAHTQRYPGDDSYGSILPDDSAWIGVEFTVVRKINTYPGYEEARRALCYRSFKTGMGPDENNESLWKDFYVFAAGPLSWWCKFDLSPDGWLLLKIFGGECNASHTFPIKRIKNPAIGAQVCESPLPPGGMFCVDRMTGQIYYSTGTCSSGVRHEVGCLQFCRPITGSKTMTGVIAAGVQPFNDQWAYDHNEYGNPPHQSSPYQTGERGKWRPKGGYTYRSSILPSDGVFGTNNRTYTSAGVFTKPDGSVSGAFDLYDFVDERANDTSRWLKADTVTRFSPSGEPMEQKDVLGVYSAVRFGHSQMLPKLVATNAQYTTVDFESFEDGNGNTAASAHSGRHSYMFGTSSPVELMGPFTVTEQVRTTGLRVQFWVRKTYNDAPDHPSRPVKVTVNGLTTAATLDSIAKTGAWVLYRLDIKDLANTATVGSTFTISFQKEIGTADQLWIDDIRVQPLDAQMTCYVYDPSWLRLVAKFDDQHFGQFYIYNGEGKLLRAAIETERGVRTVSETYYHTPLIDRDAPLMANSLEYYQMGATGQIGNFDGIGMRVGDGADEGNGMSAKTDLLDFELSPDGARTKILGHDPSQLPSLGSLNPFADSPFPWLGDTTLLNADKLGEIEIPGIPEMEQATALAELKKLETQIAELDSLRKNAGSEEERARIEEQIRTAGQQRLILLREKLGITEEKLRELQQQMKSKE